MPARTFISVDLPAPFSTDEAEHLVFPQGQADVVEGSNTGEPLDQSLDLQRDVGLGRSRRPPAKIGPGSHDR